jgi:GAF domain-containing protein
MSEFAADPLARATTVNGVLRTLCTELATGVPAEGCALSRVIGLLLVEIAAHSHDGRRLSLGRGYLLPDYPETQAVIERGEHRTVRVEDPAADVDEVKLLRELGYDGLLMLPLELDDRCWGLVELYRVGEREFTDDEVASARAIVARASESLKRVQRSAANAAA